jgi:hypothetical protein
MYNPRPLGPASQGLSAIAPPGHSHHDTIHHTHTHTHTRTQTKHKPASAPTSMPMLIMLTRTCTLTHASRLSVMTDCACPHLVCVLIMYGSHVHTAVLTCCVCCVGCSDMTMNGNDGGEGRGGGIA